MFCLVPASRPAFPRLRSSSSLKLGPSELLPQPKRQKIENAAAAMKAIDFFICLRKRDQKPTKRRLLKAFDY